MFWPGASGSVITLIHDSSLFVGRNRSLGIGMCPQWRWEKVSQDSWARAMSPFDHKILDVRVIGLSSETLEVSIEEGA